MSVLITNAHLRQGLASCRALANEGVSVIVAGPTRSNPSFYSKYAQRKYGISDASNTAVFMNELLNIVKECRPEMILPMWDNDTIVISRYRGEVENYTRIPLAPHETIMKVFDKEYVLNVAKELSIPIPGTRVYKSIHRVDEDKSGLQYPIVLKPAYQYVWSNDNFVRKAYVGYYVVNNSEELTEALSEFSDLSKYNIPLLVQERIIGPGFGCEVLIWDGELYNIFMHRRLREININGGESVLRESIYVPEIKDYALRLLREISWQGPAMVEFKYDERTKVFKLMEINGRYWGSLPLAIIAGVNFPVSHYRLAKGERLHPNLAYAKNIRCRWLEGDLHRLIKEIRYGKNRWKALKDFLNFSPNDRFDYLSWDDPRPGIALFMFKLERLLTGLIARLLTWSKKKLRFSVNTRFHPGKTGVMPTKEMGRALRRSIRLLILVFMYPFAKLVQGNEIPILAYHSVGDSGMCPYSLSLGKFGRQIEYLKDGGYRSVALRDLIAHVQGETQKVWPERVVLTFDDGFENFDTKVLPILKRYGFSAVLSVVGEFCNTGRTDTYDNGIAAPALSWDEVRRISAEGVEIASHGMRHMKLTSIPLEEANWEIRKSKEQIEAAINTEVDFFFYPHGACNGQIASLVRRNGYRAALTTSPGLVREGDNIYALRRITMKRELSLLEFKAMLTPAVEWYSSLLWGKIGQAVGLARGDIF